MFLERLLHSKDQIHKAMDIASLQQDVIAQNTANIDTPGYRRKTLSFDSILDKASQKLEGTRTHDHHISINSEFNQVQPVIVEESRVGEVRQDGNTVSIETEMARQAINTMWYQALAQRAGFDNLRKAINGK